MNFEQTIGENALTLEQQIQEVHSRYDPEVVERFKSLELSLRWKSYENPNPYQKAAFKALVDDLDASTAFHEILLDYVDNNPDDALWVSQRKIFSSLQELVMPLPRKSENRIGRRKPMVDYRYPRGYTQPARWQRAIDIVKGDELGERVHFRMNLIGKQLQSNIATRFGVLVVAMQLFGITEPNVLSEGISFGLIETMMSNHGQDIDKLPPYNFGHLRGPRRNQFEQSDRLTREFRNNLTRADLQLGTILGFDLDPPKDPLTKSYAWSNSFQAHEFKNREYRDLVAKYILEHPENMHIFSGDYTEPDHVDKVREVFPEWFNLPRRVVEMVFTEYQQSDTKHDQTDVNARELAGEDGYIFRMDFLERGSDGGLQFLNTLAPWSANLFVTPPGGEPLHIFRMRDGRATDVAPGVDLLEAAGIASKADPEKLELEHLEFGMLAA